MCLVLIIAYACTHTRAIPSPVLNRCEPKETLSRVRNRAEQCPDAAITEWELPSDGLCPFCSKDVYRYEKRLETVLKLQGEGFGAQVSLSLPSCLLASLPLFLLCFDVWGEREK